MLKTVISLTNQVNNDLAKNYHHLLEYSKKFSKNSISFTLNCIFPNHCPLCNVITTSQNITLCHECFAKIDFITRPLCNICGLPFDYSQNSKNDIICVSCLTKNPQFDSARSVMVYNKNSKKMFVNFKFTDKTHLRKLFVNWLLTTNKDLILACDVIIPVPLHKSRLIRRKYNQSALLAKDLSRTTGKPTILNAIKKHKNTIPQSELPRKKRLKNLNAAFSINNNYISNIKNSKILLIDDIMTTGATATNCSKILKKAGAKTVNVLTLARTVF